GALRPADLVWRRGSPRWLAVHSVRGLLPESPGASPGPAAGAEEADKRRAGPAFDNSATTEDGERPAAPAAPTRDLRGQPFRTPALSDFRVLRKLGAGSMGAVYLARQRSQDRLVALKVLWRHLASRPHSVQRFGREAEVMATLDHPGIVRLHGAGAEQDLY